jgi:GNAT superfamily N-acetyltransferase
MVSKSEVSLDIYLDYEIKHFNYDDVVRYLEQIIDMQFENTYMYHYPDKNPNKDYVKEKIYELKGHLQKDNTYFIGAVKDEKLSGFIWCYESIFIDEKRMHINSLFIDKSARGLGLGKKLMNEVKRISVDNGCNTIGTHYATFNKSAGEFYSSNGFEATRIEMVCNLEEFKESKNGII